MSDEAKRARLAISMALAARGCRAEEIERLLTTLITKSAPPPPPPDAKPIDPV